MLTVKSTPSDDQSQRRRRRDGCRECRRKKVKCDLIRPVCSRCRRYPKGCIYSLGIISQSTSTYSRTCPEITRHSQDKVVIPSEDAVTDASHLKRQPLMYLCPFLATTESRFFMHFFSTETSTRLFPAAPPIFIRRMIQGALEKPHLLYALLAAACSHHSRLAQQDMHQKSAFAGLKFTSLAISNLRSALAEANEMLEPETITTAMALCTNDVCNGNMNIWNVHLDGVIRLLTAFVQCQKKSSKLDPYVQCLIKWCITLDVLAGVSGLRTTQSGLLAYISNQNFDEIDEICGYSLQLASLLSELPQLVRRQERLSTTVEDFMSREVNLEAEMLEARIFRLIDARVSETTIHNLGDLATELYYTHLAFVHSTLLYLHRRVQNLPRSHIKVRQDITGIIDAIRQIGSFSSTNILILWPMFSAGCETESMSEREYIQSRMNNMQCLGMGNYTRARTILYNFWASETSLPWDIYQSYLGKEIVLF